ncbi:flavin reductase family protein [Bradyrhizobium stylosanthis]|uniref:Flavin reductase (DIM6/NTAB) family NADH-FMN oxidoreductase RutF n=1 Tax=Bradyrhizobium stylosanthis TaxID=1803665 RepID=A0A560E311_9BRAD|nr:flavin reductase family protein [Bradyrhizobium stylosanthis]TWB03653.1 flavin reductase (DIM6/NTAB) family NADH-FMN oxidoreductase RutF [Bradyrhizobium stylosanthis]
MSFDHRRLRDALGHFPTGVIIVTARTEAGEHLGMTMSSFNSVSLAPPLVVFSIHLGAASLAKWRLCRRYAINVLGEEQGHLSDRFARAKSAKWDDISPIEGQFGTPLLPEVLVALECEQYARHDGGDHELFVSRVLAIHEGPKHSRYPLVFQRGRYWSLQKDQCVS